MINRLNKAIFTITSKVNISLIEGTVHINYGLSVVILSILIGSYAGHSKVKVRTSRFSQSDSVSRTLFGERHTKLLDFIKLGFSRDYLSILFELERKIFISTWFV